MLIHAVVTITGDQAALDACEGRLRDLLSAQSLTGEATGQHRADALCYDLKVEGGIPFPVFAQASHEFPGLTFEAEWVNPETSELCGVTLVDGKAVRHDVRKIP